MGLRNLNESKIQIYKFEINKASKIIENLNMKFQFCNVTEVNNNFIVLLLIFINIFLIIIIAIEK